MSKKNKTVIFIDKEKFEVEEESLSVRALLELAGEVVCETVLALQHGKEFKRLEDLDEIIELKNGMHFIVFHESPTPVS
jgi:predicted nucleic-acid-binding protein